MPKYAGQFGRTCPATRTSTWKTAKRPSASGPVPCRRMGEGSGFRAPLGIERTEDSQAGTAINGDARRLHWQRDEEPAP
jgi:hypothetical protein